MKTPDEINAEIRRLQLALDIPRRWNDRTTETLKESIRVLREKMTPGQVEEMYYVEESTPDYKESDNDLWMALDRVAHWLKGDGDAAAPSTEL